MADWRICPRCIRWSGAFARDERGSVLLYFSIVMVVIFGFAGLVVDGGRFLMLNNKLQDLADASALAGAQELDGATAAMCRARDRAMNLLNNDPRWSNVASSATVQIREPEFYGPGIDDGPLAYSCSDSATPNASDGKASFIKVTTITRQVLPTILAAVGAASAQSTSATATAGSTYVACNVQPLMLCNPNEPAPFNPAVGTLFGFTQQGGGSGFSPGDFSLLDPPNTNSGATAIRNSLSQDSPDFCYVDNVIPRPGQAASDVADGINVRFDMQPQGNNQLSGLDQTPAPDVLKGIIPKIGGNGSCSWQGAGVQTVPDGALPGDSDTALNSNGHLWMGTQMDSQAADNYWQYHYGSPSWPTAGGVPMTRAQAYCQELHLPSDCFSSPANPMPSGTPPSTVAGTENPAPQCAPSPAGTIARRMISVAVVDCLAQGVKGGSATNVMSKEYADFFLTKPVGADGVIWAEFLRFMKPGSEGSKLHHIVQLYR